MLKKTENILFATNLSPSNRAAFKHIALLANQLHANIFLLHVIEKLPETYESRIKRLFGEEHWDSVIKQRLQEARDILVGKVSSKMIIRAAMEEICHIADIQEDQCGDVSAEIIIEQGDIVDTILHQAELHGCDLIAMGASKGLISGNTVGSHIKSVMKKAGVSVLVIPPSE